MNKIYGYCRISTKQQKMERQVSNIQKSFPGALIFKEAFTGTRMEGRKELDKLLRLVKAGDTIVFDEVSRMSRNAEEGFALYKELYSKGIEIVFLKEPHINTATYRASLNASLEPVGNDIADIYIEATNRVLMLLAEKQIRIAFEQAQKQLNRQRQKQKQRRRRQKKPEKPLMKRKRLQKPPRRQQRIKRKQQRIRLKQQRPAKRLLKIKLKMLK